MDIKVLHLSNDYSGSTVYRNLCQQLDNNGVEQVVYVPVRSATLIGRNIISFQNPKSKIIYRCILNLYTRVNYFAKIRKITNDIIDNLEVDQFDVIHAHTWYSDGGVAYELHKRYHIPYIVTIRGTDYNLFFKRLIYLRKRGLQILQNAKKIIFISPSYKQKLFSSPFFNVDRNQLVSLSQVVPNGIDDYWSKNVASRRQRINTPIQLLYVGRFIKGKNLMRLIEAVKLINRSGVRCNLNLVGGGGSHHEQIINLIENDPRFIYLGEILDQSLLREIYGKCDIFTMPSRRETFGLVYIEALSQGIPVVYSIDEGIYGYFESSIGEAVNPVDLQDIVEGISRICHNYDNYNFDPKAIANNFDWAKIARTYLNIYAED